MERGRLDTHVDMYGTNVPVRFEADWRHSGPTVTGIISVNQQAWVLEDYLQQAVNEFEEAPDFTDAMAWNEAVQRLVPAFINVTYVELHKGMDAIVWWGSNNLWSAEETGDWVLEAK